MFDIIIRNGKIIDGTGQASFQADIGIRKGRIAEITSRLTDPGHEAIEADGLVVSPGFIDMHTHSDFTLLLCPEAESRVRQGITTEVVGNCGGSPAPVPETHFDDFMQYMVDLGYLYRKALKPEEWQWKTLGRFYRDLEQNGLCVNVAPLVGHSTLRSGVMGYEPGPPSSDQLARMKRLLETELEQGAFGLSSGLIYHPGAFAGRDELTELAKVVKAYGGLYSTHIRSEGRFLFEALEETLYVAEHSKASVQVSHLKCETPVRWGQGAKVLETIDRARAKGLEVHFDQYPYRAYHTGLLEIFPTWAKENGADRMIEIINDKDLRDRVKKDMAQPPPDWDYPLEGLDWDQVRVVGFTREENRDLEGLSVDRIAAQGSMAPLEAVFRIFEEERGTLGMIVFSMSEDDIATIMQHPAGMVGSDGASVAPYGPTGKKKVHPRFYGTFPRILGRYVREKGIIPLEEAIRKMTGLAAGKLGLADRGLLKTGYRADIVVFDQEIIEDRATFENPHQYPVGIHNVLVNGQTVVSRGEHTGRRPGKVLSRTG